MAKKVSVRNTKQQILEAYKELVNENEQLQKEKRALQAKVASATASAAAVAPKKTTVPAQAAPQKAPLPKAQTSYHVEDLIGVFQNVRAGFGGAVSELSGKLVTEADSLSNIQAEIKEVESYIKSLHNFKKIDEDTLDKIMDEYEEKSKTFAKEISEKTEKLETTWEEKQKTWHKEQEAHSQGIREQVDALQNTHKREEEQYKYNLELERSLDTDTYKQSQKADKKVLAQLQEAQEKGWEKREKGVAEREKEQAETQTKADELKDKLDKETKKAREEVKGAIRKNAEIKAKLLAKQNEGQQRLNDLKIQSLEDSIFNQNNQIDSLSKQINEALREAKELAVKAIEGASNANSLSAIREIALEQAKHPSKNK